MTSVSSLIADIEGFCREAKIAETTFGFRAVRDGKLVGRLKAGGGLTVATVEKVHAYIEAQRKLMSEPATGTEQAAA